MIVSPSETTSPRDEPITDAIVTAVADAEGVDPLELPPLWDVIDTEALEALFAPTRDGGRSRRSGRVEFSYYGYEITVEYGESSTVSIER